MIKARQIITQRQNASKTLKRYLEELQQFEIIFITESSFEKEDKIHYTFFYKDFFYKEKGLE